jgi:hypothetical protein
MDDETLKLLPSESREILIERDGVTLQKTESSVLSVLTGNLVLGFDNKIVQGI